MIDTRWMELTHRDQGFSVSSAGGFVSYHESLPYHHRKKGEYGVGKFRLSQGRTA